MEDANMTSVHESKRTIAKPSVWRSGRCLIGYLDGNKKFRLTEEKRKKVKFRNRITKEWIEEGWFSGNILDD